MVKRSRVQNRRQKEIDNLNKRIAKKKSNIKTRHNVNVDIPKIDPSLKGWELRKAKQKALAFLDRKNENFQFVKNDKGVSFPKAMVKEAQGIVKRVNKDKKKAQQKLLKQPFYADGEVIGTVKDYYKMLKYNKPEFAQIKLDLNWLRDVADLKNWIARKSDVYAGDFIGKLRTQYKDNYISSILNVFGETSYTKPLLKMIQGMTADEVYIKTMGQDTSMFDFIYSKEQGNYKLNLLLKSWGLPSPSE